METHRKLTILGVVLLVATIAIYYYHEDHPDDGFNYAYVTGVSMIVVFLASLAIINKDRFKEPKSK